MSKQKLVCECSQQHYSRQLGRRKTQMVNGGLDKLCCIHRAEYMQAQKE